MKKRRLLAGLMSLAVVASLGSCERKHDMNSDASSGLVSVDDTDSSSESNHLTDSTDSSSVLGDEDDSKIRKIYDLYRANGGTLTYEEWLASIKGEKGDKGNDAPHYGETHTVTYYLDGGTMPSGKPNHETVTWGDCLDLPVPTKPGYVFLGWFYESSDVNDPTRQWTDRDAVFKDITLTAHWETATYAITLDADGGSVSSTHVEVEYRGTYTLPVPEKSGYEFLGWYDGATEWSLSGTYTQTSDVTLTAHWQKRTIYTITLNPNGGTCSVTSIQTNSDGTYTLPSYEEATRDGYVFKGWYNGSQKWEFSGTYPLTSNITLAAQWEAVENYTLTLDLNGGTYNGATGNYTFNFDNTNKYNTGKEKLPVPSKSGYTFVGYGIGANKIINADAILTDYSLSGKALKALYKADDGSLSGDVCQFGNYPKTMVTDVSLIQSLATATDTDSDGWLNYNGREYAKEVSYSSTSYFEVEPLLWKVLDSSTGLLFAMDIIDQQVFYSGPSRTMDGLTLYGNNYKYSNLRAWLNGYNGTSYSVSDYSNGGFLNTAFTATERTKIETTTVDNSPASTGYSSNSYACDNTQDKVFALSYTEVTNSSYGLNSATGRIGKATDYAAAHGSGPFYWLRSPSNRDGGHNAKDVNRDGDINYYDGVSYYGVYSGLVGVRPAFRMKIS